MCGCYVRNAHVDVYVTILNISMLTLFKVADIQMHIHVIQCTLHKIHTTLSLS